MDLVTLTDASLGMDKLPVRITKVDEDESGEMSVEAEDFPLGVATAATYPSQQSLGFAANYTVAPGSVTAPVIFEAPGALSTTSGLNLWVAVRGASPDWGGCVAWVSLDGTNYRRFGEIAGGSRYGKITGPVSGGVLPVLLNGGQLVSGSATDSAQLVTLCYIGGANPEYLAYQTATLTAANAYNLGGLTRSAYGTSGAAHSANDPFVRCDDSVLKSLDLDRSYIGKTIYFKFTSFNIYGGATQSLADAVAYTYTPTGAFVGSSQVANQNISISGGAIQGIGAGAGTPVANSSISISGNAIQGIGTGNGTAVANSAITMNANGTLSGAGGGQASLTSLPGVVIGSKIAVVDMTNIVRNPDFASGSSDGFSLGTNGVVLLATDPSVPAGAPTQYVFRRAVPSANVTDLSMSNWIAAAPGETFYFEATVAADAGTNGSLTLQMRYGGPTPNANNLGVTVVNLTTPATYGSWTRVGANITVPTTVGAEPVSYVRFYIRSGTNAAPVGAWNITRLIARRSANSEMVVDGSITAIKINANGLTVRNQAGTVLLNAAGSAVPPWVVALAGAGSGVSLVEAANSSNNTASIRSLSVGPGLSIDAASGVVSLSLTQSAGSSIRLLAEQSFSTTTPAQVTNFSLPLAAGKTYLIRGALRVKSAAATTGLVLGCETPTGCDVAFIAEAQTAVSATQQRTAHTSAGGALSVTFSDHWAATAAAPATFSATAFTVVHFQAVVTVGTTAGVFQVTAASEVNASAVAIGANSIITAQEVVDVTAAGTASLAAAPAGIATSYFSGNYSANFAVTAACQFRVNTSGTWEVLKNGTVTNSGTWLAGGSASQWDLLLEVTATSEIGATATRSNTASAYTQITQALSYTISITSPAASDLLVDGSSTIAVRFRNRSSGAITTLQTTALQVQAESASNSI